MGWLLFSSEVRASWEEWGEGGGGCRRGSSSAGDAKQEGPKALRRGTAGPVSRELGLDEGKTQLEVGVQAPHGMSL